MYAVWNQHTHTQKETKTNKPTGKTKQKICKQPKQFEEITKWLWFCFVFGLYFLLSLSLMINFKSEMKIRVFECLYKIALAQTNYVCVCMPNEILSGEMKFIEITKLCLVHGKCCCCSKT